MASTLAFTYNELIAEIQTTAEDTSTEFVAEMPTIVSAGETRLYGDLNFEIFDRERTGVLTINVNEQPIKPATWQGTRSLWVTPVGGGASVYLQRRTIEYCRDFQPDPAVNRAQPIYYAELDETDFFVAPSPDVAYPFIMREIGREPVLLLTAANQNTWLGDNLGDLLYYACMIQAEIYLKSDAVDIDKWKQVYAETLPIRRGTLRRQLRGDYAPIRNAARTAEPTP
jgi:hypothetical protein